MKLLASGNAFRKALSSLILAALILTGGGYGQPSMEKSLQKQAMDQFKEAAVPQVIIDKMQTAMTAMKAPSFDYPWSKLETTLDGTPSKTLTLIGYGSLLNRESAARTIKDTPADGHPPAIAIGGIRVFNYVIPDKTLARYGGNYPTKERAALNVIHTGRPQDGFNGRILKVRMEDLADLREREHGYDLRPVICSLWNDWNSEPFVAYVLVAQKSVVNGIRVVDNDLLPHPPYYKVCRAGAAAVSNDFLILYLSTTYLADRTTSLVEWETIHPDLRLPARD